MSERDPELERLFRAARREEAPTDDDRRAVRRAIAARIAAAAAAGTTASLVTRAAAAAGAASVGKATMLGWFAAGLGAGATLGAVVTATVVLQERDERPKVSSPAVVTASAPVPHVVPSSRAPRDPVAEATATAAAPPAEKPTGSVPEAASRPPSLEVETRALGAVTRALRDVRPRGSLASSRRPGADVRAGVAARGARGGAGPRFVRCRSARRGPLGARALPHRLSRVALRRSSARELRAMTLRSRVAALVVLGTPAAACEAKWVSMGYDVPVENLGTMPNGPFWSCYGAGCPCGECDNEEFVTDVDCDDVFPGPVDDSALFCQPSVEESYCLLIGDDSLSVEYWVVTCGGGIATADRCGSGCSAASFEGATCL